VYDVINDMKHLFLFPLLSILLCSCYSYRISKREWKNAKVTTQASAEKETVYVINPELSDEYSILQASNIFHIAADSVDPTVRKIKLLTPTHQFICGNFLIGWGMFLGQLPISIPSSTNFRFAAISDGKEIIQEFELPFRTRFWFWDIFSRRKNYNKVAGEALRLSFYSK